MANIYWSKVITLTARIQPFNYCISVVTRALFIWNPHCRTVFSLLDRCLLFNGTVLFEVNNCNDIIVEVSYWYYVANSLSLSLFFSFLSFFLTVFTNMHLLILKTVNSKCSLITSKCKLILNKVLLGNVGIYLAPFSTCALNYVLS